LLTIREPARPALVPYTTLFRSNLKAVKDGRVYRAPTQPFGWFDSPPGVNRLMSVTWLTEILYPGKAEFDMGERTREFYRLFYQVDRKSTRLNSSHVKISYAVFC